MRPDDLRDLARLSIERHIYQKAWDETLEEQAEEREELQRIADEHDQGLA